MTDYIFDAKDCFMSIPSGDSLLVLPRELWEDLRDGNTNYLLLGYTKEKKLYFMIKKNYSGEFDICYGFKLLQNHSGWLVSFQTYRNNYAINLRYTPLKEMPWLPNDIETIVVKDLSLDNIVKSLPSENLVI